MIPLYTITQVKKKNLLNLSEETFRSHSSKMLPLSFFFTAAFAHIEIYDDKIINYNAIKHSEKY